MTETHRFIDEWLVRAAAALPDAATRIEEFRKARKPCLFDALVDTGIVTEAALRAAVRSVFRIDGVTANEPEKPAVALIPEKICRRYRLVPLRLHGEMIDVAMQNPLDLEALADVQALAGRTPVAQHARPSQLDALLSEAYNPDSIVFDLVERLDEKSTVELFSDRDAPVSTSIGGPVEKLISSLISKAFNMRASDIHLEHDEKLSTVRFRIDGVLKNIVTLPRNVGAGPAVSRLKIMANLDIADRLRPQDGRAKLRIAGVELGLRVSTLPTNFGEKVVIRLLDKRSAEVPFEKLGIRPDLAAKMAAALKTSQGLVLVTGPTGSGKTTTLYSAINLLRNEETNIVTVEDPVEYKLDGINQVQVQEKQGLTFAAALRSVLRQDPDVILVGEIRDRETAETAMQAASTGHLVIASLHTNDSVSTLARLVDIGIERYKLAPALIAISAQRLARSLCPACRAPAAVVDAALAAAQRARGQEPRQFVAVGCAVCDFAGYKGRTSLVELFEATPGVKARIASGASDAELTQFSVGEGSLSTLLDDALWHIGRGDTTLEEVLPYIRLATAPVIAAAAPAPQITTAPPSPMVLTAAGPAPARTSAVPAADRPAPCILVADDDPTIRMILRKTLEMQGYRIEEADDGPTALAAIAARSPDMLLVDLNMPGLDGYGVIHGARESLGLTSLPILMLTADSDENSQTQAFALGADDYITKPFQLPVVVARVKAAFRRAAV
jgi:type IV pilus assembly protein PilB